MIAACSRFLLLMHGGALGDFVLATALAEALRAALDLHEIRTACRSHLACYLTRRGVLAGWKSIEHPAYSTLFALQGPVPEAVAQPLRSASCVVSLLGSPDSRVHQRLRSVCAGQVLSVDSRLRQATAARGQHIVEQWLGDIAAQGGPQLTWSAQSATTLQARACAAGSPRIVIHPGSGGRRKCWPLERFREVDQRLQALRWCTRFMIGPVERECWTAEELSRLGGAQPPIVEPDVCDAAEALQGASVFIGNDSGMTHVAALLGMSTIALFTTTPASSWRPLGPRVTVLQQPGVAEVVAAV